MSNGECKCSLREKVVGDGCYVCNPERALEYAKETISELEQQRDELYALLAEFALLASAIATDGAEPDHRREYAKRLANKAESIAKHRGKQ